MNGEITIHGLICIGCSKRQIDELKVFSKSPINENLPKKENYQNNKKVKFSKKVYKKISVKRGIGNEKGSLLFKELISNKIKQTLSFEISRRASKDSYQSVCKYVDSLQELTATQKTKVKILCKKYY